MKMKKKKKIKIAHFCGKKNKENEVSEKWKMTLLLPFKLIGKFHKAYVNAMLRLSLPGEQKREKFVEKRVPKGRPCPSPMLLAAHNNEMVDTRMVLELYNRVVSMSYTSYFVS